MSKNKFFNFNYKSVSTELVWISIGMGAQFISAFWWLQILSSKLSTSSFGTFNLWNSIIQGIELIFLTSIIQAAGRFSFDGKHAFLSFKVSENILRTALKITFGTFLLIAGFYWLYLNNYETALLLPLIALSIIFDVIREQLLGKQHMARNRKDIAIIRLIDLVCKPIFLYILALKTDISLNYIFALYFLSSLMSVVFLYSKFYKNDSEKTKELEENEKMELRKKMLKYAFLFGLISIFTWFQTWGDRWLILKMLDVKEVGIYSVYTQFGNITFTLLSGLILTFLGPIIFKKVEQISEKIELAQFEKLCNKLLLGIFFIFIVALTSYPLQLIILKKYFIDIKYFEHGYLFYTLGIGWLLFHFGNIYSTIILHSMNRLDWLLTINIINGFIYAILLYFLINNFGMLGASYAFIASGVIKFIIQWYFGARALIQKAKMFT